MKVDNAIHRINHYPVNSVVFFVNTYPLDSDLSGGSNNRAQMFPLVSGCHVGVPRRGSKMESPH